MKVIIPNYLKKVKTANARRPKYFIFPCKLPLKYEGSQYIWRNKGKVKALYDTKAKAFVIKNSKSVGTASYQAIAGNEIYARMHERKRMMIVNNLKDDFKKHISEQISIIPESMMPLSITMEVHTSFGYGEWDVDNLWIYHKCFLDSLRDLKLIPDDSILYVRQAGQTTFVPILPDARPTMIFEISSCADKCIRKSTEYVDVKESCFGEVGKAIIHDGHATIITGKTKVIFGAAKEAIRSLMTYCLNNFKTPCVPEEMYNRYRDFFEENTFGGQVKIIKT